ncbi:MAG: SOS response-associated peptidase [Planctomycetaceae bacterium]|nr:SOS response-associated peptidase [Planctomycetaceae bacterium]
MCGRYTLRTPAPKLVSIFDVPGMPELAPRYNIAPTQQVLCIRCTDETPENDSPDREAIMMRWGLIPSWSASASQAARMINARSETVQETPSFQKAFRQRRCLILADGFFEWEKNADGSRQPWLIHLPENEPFAMAGIWESWICPPASSEVDGSDRPAHPDPILSCSILTTSANQDMRPLHHRMPVIVPSDRWTSWLSHDFDPGSLESAMCSLPDGLLLRYRVTRAMGRPAFDGPECVCPLVETGERGVLREHADENPGTGRSPRRATQSRKNRPDPRQRSLFDE